MGLILYVCSLDNASVRSIETCTICLEVDSSPFSHAQSSVSSVMTPGNSESDLKGS